MILLQLMEFLSNYTNPKYYDIIK